MSVPESPPPPPAAESMDCGEDRAECVIVEGGSEASSSAETCASSYPGWIKSPERAAGAGLTFSPVNSNLRDLTPSHTLEPLTAPFRPETAAGSAAGTGALVASQGPFSESQGQLFYPSSEDGSSLGFSRSLSGDGSGEGGGSAQNPPQKKKVRNNSASNNLGEHILLLSGLMFDVCLLSGFPAGIQKASAGSSS